MSLINQRSIVIETVKSLNNIESWCGETHIQKNTYIMQELGLIPPIFEFILYKHGPFSFDLRAFLNELLSDYLLDIKTDNRYGPHFFVSQHGETYLQKYGHFINDHLINIHKVVDVFGKKNIYELEQLSTALFFIKNNKELNDQQRSEGINQIKPHITIDSAFESIQNMNHYLATIQ